MTAIVDLLGEANAQRLADAAGGTRLFIPKHHGAPPGGGRDGSKRLALLVGPDLATLLIFHFADSVIYVPRLGRSEPVDSRTIVRLSRRHSAAAIARRLGCSERTVYKHLARTQAGSIPKTPKA